MSRAIKNSAGAESENQMKSGMNPRFSQTYYNREPCVTPPIGTWNCIPSADRTTVHSESATEFTSGFPSYIPRGCVQM